jgi:hypothetical protein
MKKLIFGLIIGISFTALVGAGIESYTVNKNTATVEMYQNIRIFTDSKPVMEYEYLGTVKVHLSTTGFYSEIREILIKNAKKKYPNVEGIIIKDNEAEVIKFK